MPEPWQLELPQAVLRADTCSARLTVAEPQRGLESVFPYFKRHEDARLFQVRIGHGEPGKLPVADAYTRLNDLIVSYAESAVSTCSSQIYWRFLDPSDQKDMLSGIDVIISAQTSLLDAQPEIMASSRIAAAEVLRLADADSAACQTMDIGPTPKQLGPDGGPGCFLFRPADENFSYVEMIHPTDFSRAELLRPEGDREVTDLRHVVINRWMEKGVIVRARLRGVFVSRSDDALAAGRVYRNFCTAEIPLTV
ncbi:MAG: hypothetical protein GTO53_11290 [Planctomycetales bacterium]|nr:hypothetical protein [Planctomycetales bacterium]NIM09700.1 hypothetical protein [Planctomycetales bacterium]NIN09177.1 hypothetical protein [Planctomycetales bacterium]NIN78282.1 hypothetical protein [Planctomycetales bacterium]NIO35473.1 hypothetical protein [Planctomycetales bacterium]